MLIQRKIGNLATFAIDNRRIDRVPVQWFETNKRILHKRTQSGRELVLKFLKEAPNLAQDDVLYEDATSLVVIDIPPCEAIVVRPGSMHQMACLCYEIGNKHLPLFYENDEILVPYEAPLFRLLQTAGFEPLEQVRKLLYPLKTSVAPHSHSSSTLFSKILQLTTPAGD
jgi:urease accessory protein